MIFSFEKWTYTHLVVDVGLYMPVHFSKENDKTNVFSMFRDLQLNVLQIQNNQYTALWMFCYSMKYETLICTEIGEKLTDQD